MDSFRKDFLASLSIGIMAGPLFLAMTRNLEINTPWFFFILGFPVSTIGGVVIGRIPALKPLRDFIKFGEVGGLNWLVDLGLVNLLVLLSGISDGWTAFLFKSVSFSVAVGNSYFWNRFWVFPSKRQDAKHKELLRFIAASLLGLGVNLLAFFVVQLLLQAGFTGFSSKISINIAAIAGSLAAMLFNFLLYKTWVFSG